jgi:hypothetical protein
MTKKKKRKRKRSLRWFFQRRKLPSGAHVSYFQNALSFGEVRYIKIKSACAFKWNKKTSGNQARHVTEAAMTPDDDPWNPKAQRHSAISESHDYEKLEKI